MSSTLTSPVSTKKIIHLASSSVSERLEELIQGKPPLIIKRSYPPEKEF